MILLHRGLNETINLDSRNPLNLRCVTKAQMERKAMEQDAVAVSLLSVTTFEFDYRDYLLVDGRPYFLNTMPKLTKADRRHFLADLTFEGGMYELGRAVFTMTDLHGWDYSGRLDDFCRLVINEMNRHSLVLRCYDGENDVEIIMRYTGSIISGLYLWCDINSDIPYYFTDNLIPSVGDIVHPTEASPTDNPIKVTEVGGAWTLDFETEQGKPVETDDKFLTFDNHTCLAVMHELVSQWSDWEFAVDCRTSDLCAIDYTKPIQCGGRIILRRKATGIFISGVNTDHLMSYGKKGGISKITREYPDGSIPSRIYFYGGTQNVPTTYRNTRICLPNAKKEESYIDTGFSDNEIYEVVKIFDDIYPACKQFSISGGAGMSFGDDRHFTISMFGTTFFDLFAQWKDPDEATPSEYGSYQEWKLFYGTGNASTDRSRYLAYYYGDPQQQQAGFPKSCYLVGDVTVTFQTGDLAGHSFKVTSFDNTTPLWFAFELACEGIESEFNEPMRFFPNGDIMCKYGDKFIVEGCLMPASFVYANFGSGDYAAESLLEVEAKKYIDELSSKIKVGIEISQDFINQHNAVFRLYDKINITDIDVLPEHEKTYFAVRRVIYDLLKNSYKVEIDDGKGINPWAAISQYVERIRPIK